MLEAYAFFVIGFGCFVDDGPMDYGTAGGLQRSYCELAYKFPNSTVLHLLPFAPPLIVFVLANGATRLRSRWILLLAAAPLLIVTGVGRPSSSSGYRADPRWQARSSRRCPARGLGKTRQSPRPASRRRRCPDAIAARGPLSDGLRIPRT